jgi:hypothetical protein
MQERIAVLSCKRDTLYSVPNAIRPAAAVTPPPVHLGLVATIALTEESYPIKSLT